VDTAREGVLVLALMINFDDLIVLDDRHARFVAARRDH
jgi:hypothetical protein